MKIVDTESFEESGMKFGPYPEGKCFRIEKSKIYEEIQQNVKMAESSEVTSFSDSFN